METDLLLEKLRIRSNKMHFGYSQNQIPAEVNGILHYAGFKFRSKNKHRIAKRLSMIVLLTILVICSNLAYAHRPHDDIRDVGISPDFNRDGTAFIIFFNDTVLKRTTDYGDSWKWLSNGLDYVYPLTSIAVSPNFETDGTVFVSSQGDGIYKSSDGGDSWIKMNDGLGSLDICKVVASPNFVMDNTVLAADVNGKLYRTHDGGKNWGAFYESEGEIISIAFIPDDSIKEVVVGDSGGTFYRFSNNHWTKITAAPNSGAITSIAISPYFRKDRTIWIGTEHKGVLKTLDGGDSFKQANNKLSEKNITSLIVMPRVESGISLFASTWYEAIFRSDDGGESWHKFDRGLSTDPQADFPSFLRPHFRGIAVHGNYCFLGGFDGLFLSKDGGKQWRQLETWPVSSISLLSLSPIINGGKQSGVLAYGGGAYFIPDVRSNDWVKDAVCLTLSGVKGKRTDGGVSDVVFSPSYATDRTIFVASEHELIKTTDKGKNWSRVEIKRPLKRRVRRKLYYYMRRMGISSELRLKILGFFPDIPGWPTKIAVSPNYGEDGTVFFGTTGIGQCSSSDRGKSCSVIFNTTNQITTSMAISPLFTKDRTLFIGLENRRILTGYQRRGIYLTKDGGETFKQSDKGVDIVGEVKLAMSPEYDKDHILLAGTGAGLFITKDGGKTWNRTGEKGLPEKANIMHLAFSPNFGEDQTLMLAIRGRGIFKSTDGGETFSAIGSDLIHKNEQLKMIRFSNLYAQDSTLYGVSMENVFRSSDGGRSWHLVQRPVRYEDARDVILRVGNWETVFGPEFSDSSLIRSKVDGDRATLRFLGSGIRWISEKGPEGGHAKVYIDGKLMEEVSLVENSYHATAEAFSLSGLPGGAHEITIEVCGKDTDKGWVAIDAFEILP